MLAEGHAKQKKARQTKYTGEKCERREMMLRCWDCLPTLSVSVCSMRATETNICEDADVSDLCRASVTTKDSNILSFILS